MGRAGWCRGGATTLPAGFTPLGALCVPLLWPSGGLKPSDGLGRAKERVPGPGAATVLRQDRHFQAEPRPREKGLGASPLRLSGVCTVELQRQFQKAGGKQLWKSLDSPESPCCGRTGKRDEGRGGLRGLAPGARSSSAAPRRRGALAADASSAPQGKAKFYLPFRNGSRTNSGKKYGTNS